MRVTLVSILFIYYSLVFSQNYQTDTSFGVNGRLNFDFNTEAATFMDGVELSNGNFMMLAIAEGVRLIQFNPQGVLDVNFGSNGWVNDNELPYDSNGKIKILSDGKYLICTNYLYTNTSNQACENPVFIKFNSDGSPDTTFGTNGKRIHDFSGQLLDFTTCVITNDAIFFVGSIKDDTPQSRDFFVAKFDENGQLVSSFGNNGVLRINVGVLTDSTVANLDMAKSLKVMPNGDIVIVGETYTNPLTYSNIAVVKTTSTGQIDSSFGVNGRQIVNFDLYSLATSVEVSPTAIYLVGSTRNSLTSNPNFPFKIALAKFTNSGAIDFSFGISGKRTIADEVSQYNLVPVSSQLINESILVTSKRTNNVLFRFGTRMSQFNLNGEDDLNFGQNGNLNYYYVTGPTEQDPNTETFSVPSFVTATSDGGLILAGNFSYPNSFNEMLLFAVKYQNTSLQTTQFATSNVTIVPNPFTDEIYLKFAEQNIENQIVAVYDSFGKTIEAAQSFDEPQTVKLSFFNSLPQGLYFVKVVSNAGVAIHKVIKA